MGGEAVVVQEARYTSPPESKEDVVPALILNITI